MPTTEESVRRAARVLAGFMTQQEAQGFAGTFTLDPNQFLAVWQARALQRAQLSGGYSAPKVEDLPSSASAHILQLVGNAVFQQLYPSAEFKMIELGKLIAFQHWMDTDVSNGVHAGGAQTRPDDNEILTKCLPAEIIPPSKTQWQGNHGSVTVSSLNNTLGFYGPQVDAAKGEVRFGVGAGANLMLVRECEGRYVLANGYHRAWWLRRSGVELVPVVVKHVGRGELTQPGAIPIDVLMGSRPPLFDDFLDDSLSCTVEVRSMMRVVKITAEVLVVPRLL